MSELAFLFPGQGSQSLGMLADFADDYPQILETFSQASKVLGYDLWSLVQDGPSEHLNQTEYAQPAILTASIALWSIYCEMGGPMPSYLAGHSLGEYSALVCAGVLSFSDAVSLVAARGRYMQAQPEGAMAAIVGLSNQEISEVCAQASQGQVLTPANYNAIGQVVLAGEKPAVERAIRHAKDSGARMAVFLPVSVASHCELMRGASESLELLLSDTPFYAAQYPVIQNVDVAAYEHPQDIRSALVRQLSNPVRWVETIQHLAAEGIRRCVECGPGAVLTGLGKRITPALPTYSLSQSTFLRELA